MFTAGFLSHILIISMIVWFFSQIKMYNNNNVAMNLLPALTSLLFCWMFCWWVIAQGPDQWPLKAGLLLISYWPLDWPPFKASLWRQLLWFAKMYQEEILDLTCWQEMGVLVFLFFWHHSLVQHPPLTRKAGRMPKCSF